MVGIGDRILLVIVSFLLTIFPWSPSLIGLSQSLSYPGDQKIADAIVEMIKTDNVDEIYELVNDNLKEDYSDLKQKLHDMVNIFDEEIVSYKYDRRQSSSSSREAAQSLDIVINTATKVYKIQTIYIIKHIYHPEYVGFDYFLVKECLGQYSFRALWSIYPTSYSIDISDAFINSIKNNNPKAALDATSIYLKEKYPDLEEQYKVMMGMIEGNFIDCKTISFLFDREYLDLYTDHIVIYETDKGSYSILIKSLDWLKKGTPQSNGVIGVTLSKINEDGTLEELFSVMDEESWYHDFVNAP